MNYKRVFRDKADFPKILKALGFLETGPGFSLPGEHTDPISLRYPGLNAHINLNTGEPPEVVVTHSSLFLLDKFVAEAMAQCLPKVGSTIKFNNGMVATCDRRGKQIPELQGDTPSLHKKISDAADGDTEWYGYGPLD